MVGCPAWVTVDASGSPISKMLYYAGRIDNVHQYFSISHAKEEYILSA